MMIKRRNIDFSKGQVLKFKYAEPFSCHYLYRGAVDNHNYMRHGGGGKHHIGLENAWITQRFATKVITFCIACTEVNSLFCLKYFLKKYEYLRCFRLRLEYSLIKHSYLGNNSDKFNLEKIIKNKRVHNLETAPDHANKWRGQIDIVVQIIDTRDTYTMGENAKSDNLLHM